MGGGRVDEEFAAASAAAELLRRGREVATALQRSGIVVERVLEARQGRLLQLPHALTRELELAPDLLEREALLPVEAEPKLEHAALALRKARQRRPHAIPLERLVCLVDRVGGGPVGEQVA